jgi:TolB-like protein/tetratricopeptide (TPR) repeat protein
MATKEAAPEQPPAASPSAGESHHDAGRSAGLRDPSRSEFWHRVKEHKVVQWTIAYGAAAYTLLHIVEMVASALDWPHLVVRILTLSLIFGIPVAATLAWYHGHRALRRVSGPELAILTVLLIIAGGVLWFIGRPSHDHASAGISAETPALVSKSPSAAALPEKSIAVLPFLDMSEKKDQEYFADGMAEEVIDLLARLPGLKVIGRTSSFQFRSKALDVRSIGAALGVAHVLEGSVRRSGDKVRVTAQLLNTRDGAHEWSETYETRFNDVLSVQDAIASNLARALEVAVGTMATWDTRSETPEAYDLFMQGRQALDTNSEEGCKRAVSLFTQVLQLNPKSTRALVFLARTYTSLGDEGWLPPGDAFGKARQLALRALQVDPNNSGAHVVLAYVHLVYDWDWPEAEREMDVAFKLGQRDGWALSAAAEIASAQAQWSRAEQLVREALAQDPLDPIPHMLLGNWVYVRQGRYAEAEGPIRRALQINPTFGTGRYFLAVCLLMQGRLNEALAEGENELPRDGKYQVQSLVLYAMHRKSESDDALKTAIKQSEADWPMSIARVYAFRGEYDQALMWLERAYQYRDEDLYFIKGDPQLRSMEADPRYKAFLRKMNLPE